MKTSLTPGEQEMLEGLRSNSNRLGTSAAGDIYQCRTDKNGGKNSKDTSKTKKKTPGMAK